MTFDFSTETLFGTDGGQLYSVDLATGGGTLLAPIAGSSITALAFNSTTNELLGANSSQELIRIDANTGLTTTIGGFGKRISGLAFDSSSGSLWGVDNVANALLTINLATGLASSVGQLGFEGALTIAADPTDGRLYASDISTTQLFEVDPLTGVGPSSGRLGDSCRVSALQHLLYLSRACLPCYRSLQCSLDYDAKPVALSTKRATCYPTVDQFGSPVSGPDNMKFIQFAVLLFCVAFGRDNLTGDIVTYDVRNSDDIVIPTFNPLYGQLSRVDLSVTSLATTTSDGPFHTHPTFILRSENSLLNPQSFSQRIHHTLSGGNHRHVLTRNFEGSGLILRGFRFASEFDGAHQHELTIDFAGFVSDGEDGEFALARIVTGPGLSPGHFIPEDQNQYTFRAATGGLDPFLGTEPISIDGGAFALPTDGGHGHVNPAFQIDVGPPSATWLFSSTQAGRSGDHQHVIDPRFDISVTYTFEPSTVPEPSSLATLCVFTAMVWLPVRRRRIK